MRTPAFALVTVALVFQLAGDALYGFGSLHGWYQAGDSVDLFFVVAAVLWGTAALHPSMVELTEPNPDPEQRLSGRRLAVLSAATLTPPAMLAVAAVHAGSSELLVIVGAGAALSALVIVRLAGLVARHERSERREHVLGAAAAALVTAWTQDDIFLVAVDAGRQIAGDDEGAVELVVDGELVAGAGRATAAATVRTELPIAVLGHEGALVVRTREQLPKQAREGLETLAAQVALALESANYAEQVHERQSAERFRSLVQNSSDVILLLSQDLTIRYHTPSAQAVLGYGEDELVGTKLTALLRREDAERLGGFYAEVRAIPATPMPRDLLLSRKDGTTVQLESVFNNLEAVANVGGVVVTARDVTERRALEDQLAYQAFHDSLTGLANRALFSERIAHALARGVRRQNVIAVLFIDLDDFKTVNDSLGHAAGDELLVAVAERIRASIRPEDTCARLGGDEFAVMVESISDPEGAVAVARRILGTMSKPLTVRGAEVAVQGSIGIALGSGDQTASELMRSADLAMYRAKSEGKGRYALYEPSMHERVLERLELKADLQRAIVADEFAVHYQPIVTLQSGTIVGVEALVRWNHPQRGLVAPGDFIGLAEETGLILPLGRHVLQEACRQAATWRSARSRAPRSERQHLGEAARKQSAAQRGDRGARRRVARRVGAHARDHREHTPRQPRGRQPARGAARPRRADRDRRLRDGLLVAQLPPPLPRRHAQDRTRIRRGDRLEQGAGQARCRDPPPRLDDGSRHGRRGDRRGDPARRLTRTSLHVRAGVLLLPPGARRRARLRCSSAPSSPERLFRPEVLEVLGVVGGSARHDLGHDDELRVLGLVVPDGAPRLRRDTDGRAALELHDVVVQLELQLAGRDEVDLLLLLVAVAVRALAARVLRHAPIREGDLLGLEVTRHHPHLARVVPEDVVHLLEALDRVVGHLASSFGSRDSNALASGRAQHGRNDLLRSANNSRELPVVVEGVSPAELHHPPTSSRSRISAW